MNEPKQTALDTLAEVLVEQKRELELTRHEHQLVRKELQEKIHRLDQANGDNSALHITIKILEDRLADCAKQKNEPAGTEEVLAHKNRIIKNQSEANDWQAKKIAELTDNTVPDAKNKLEAYWQGRTAVATEHQERNIKLERLYQSTKEELFSASRKCDELTKERDALRIAIGNLECYAKALAKVQDAVLKLRE